MSTPTLSRRATIVGAGVSGLTTATIFREAGWDVSIVARETHASTVSVVAAAVWTIIDGAPLDVTRRWALSSRTRFASLAALPESGVVPLPQRELARVDPGPNWWDRHPFVRRLAAEELGPGYAAGFEIDGFMVEPPIYLPWLVDGLGAHDCTVTIGEVDRLEDLDGDVVVNCSGLGAASLAGDQSLYPIGGQVVVVPNPGISDAVSDESDPARITYVYPRSREVILGGVRQVGSSASAPDPATTERILADCAHLDPRIDGLEAIDVRVGSRPGRPTVRVEAAVLPDGRPVVHNYGHGGAGYILSWGAALEALSRAMSATR